MVIFHYTIQLHIHTIFLKYVKFKSCVVFFLHFPETIAEEIEIPSVFTSYYASQILRNFIIPEQG